LPASIATSTRKASNPALYEVSQKSRRSKRKIRVTNNSATTSTNPLIQYLQAPQLPSSQQDKQIRHSPADPRQKEKHFRLTERHAIKPLKAQNRQNLNRETKAPSSGIGQTPIHDEVPPGNPPKTMIFE
jgi:hypothetical protein